MSTRQDTPRICDYCGRELVRKMVQRRSRDPHLEPPKAFAQRRYCDMACWRADQETRRGPRPECACGCGRCTTWRGHTRGGWSRYAPGCWQRRRRPRHAPWSDTDPAFWAWFSGFTDGEGCFGITLSRSNGGTWPQPFFKIAVRADERPILEDIKTRIGCGRINVHVPGSSTSNLQLKFELTSLSDCERLIEILTAHPLRAKKRYDFAIWTEAVREKAANGSTDRLRSLRADLMAVRKFNAERAEGGDAA